MNHPFDGIYPPPRNLRRMVHILVGEVDNCPNPQHTSGGAGELLYLAHGFDYVEARVFHLFQCAAALRGSREPLGCDAPLGGYTVDVRDGNTELIAKSMARTVQLILETVCYSPHSIQTTVLQQNIWKISTPSPPRLQNVFGFLRPRTQLVGGLQAIPIDTSVVMKIDTAEVAAAMEIMSKEQADSSAQQDQAVAARHRLPLALLFDPFESMICEAARYHLSFIVLNICAGLYIIIAVSFWFYPSESPPASRANLDPNHLLLYIISPRH
ncbi:hypothetical protein EDD22DRAFT_1006116 [Suillus occidentalis]|nr:hypothetical protein EDD22DRAFT_1006116 [Suillus occidentalis]